MNSEKIGFMEAIALISVVMINKIILNTPKEIISSTRFICMVKCYSYFHFSYFNDYINYIFIQKISRTRYFRCLQIFRWEYTYYNNGNFIYNIIIISSSICCKKLF